MFNLVPIEKATDSTNKIFPVGEGKIDEEASGKFGKLLRSFAEMRLDKGKTNIKATDISDVENPSEQKPLIFTNEELENISQLSSESAREKEKQAGLLGVFIGYYLNETDINQIFPEGLENFSGTVSQLLDNLETLIDDKIIRGETENFSQDPKIAFAELQSAFITTMEKNPEAVISKEQWVKIKMQATEVAVMQSKTEPLKKAENVMSMFIQPKEAGENVSLNAVSSEEVNETDPIQTREIRSMFAALNQNDVKTEIEEGTQGVKLQPQEANVPKTETNNMQKTMPFDVNDSFENVVEAEVEQPLPTVQNVEPKTVGNEQANSQAKTLPDASSLKNEMLSKAEFSNERTGSNADKNDNKNNFQRETVKLKLVETQEPQTDDKPLKDNFHNYLKEPVAQTKEGSINSNVSKTYAIQEPEDMVRLLKTIEQSLNKNGQSQLTVTLRPEHLGKLEIRLIEHAGKLTAKFFTDNESGHKLMLSHSEIIRQQLTDKGIVIDNMDFAFKDASGRNDNGEGRRSSKTNQSKRYDKDDEDMPDDISVSAIVQKNNNAVYA